MLKKKKIHSIVSMILTLCMMSTFIPSVFAAQSNEYVDPADSCTKTSAPSYTKTGYYPIYYKISYKYGGETMTKKHNPACRNVGYTDHICEICGIYGTDETVFSKVLDCQF